MNNSIKKLIEDSLIEASQKIKEGGISWKSLPPIFISRPKNRGWGDLSTNFPFSLSRVTGQPASRIGNLFVSFLEDVEYLYQVKFAPPGFINFSISPSYLEETVKKVLIQGEEFTQFDYGKGKRVQVEFISANPTGPLHIGHGRGAALGDSLANILSRMGYLVEREYYVNDVGGQIKRLSFSVLARLRQLQGRDVPLPEGGYKGEYLIEIAKRARDSLGGFLEGEEEEILEPLGEFTVREILGEIKRDLDEFGIRYDNWFRESSLYKRGKVDKVISCLRDKGYIYEKDGALWFKISSIMDDEEDRVLRRKNGEYTYIASDIAYHQDKFLRGFDQVIDIWGADHIGYVARLKAAVQVLGHSQESLKVIIYQLVNLIREGKRASASTREGKFISLREVLREVGRDACRFFFLSRGCDSHLDFDLELAKRQTPENPVFYIQYAHARICSILERANKEGIVMEEPDKLRLNLLTTPEERELMKRLALLPDEVKEAAKSLEPHRLTTYLEGMASLFHQFYTKHRVISEKRELTLARLSLIKAIKIALGDVLNLLGIHAPSKM